MKTGSLKPTNHARPGTASPFLRERHRSPPYFPKTLFTTASPLNLAFSTNPSTESGPTLMNVTPTTFIPLSFKYCSRLNPDRSLISSESAEVEDFAGWGKSEVDGGLEGSCKARQKTYRCLLRSSIRANTGLAPKRTPPKTDERLSTHCPGGPGEQGI